jgi:hypothetical protein
MISLPNQICYINGSVDKPTHPQNVYAFDSAIISNVYSPTKRCWVITFDGTVTSIGRSAFSDCSDLKRVFLGSSVRYIGDEAFFCCEGLETITIPHSVLAISDAAFYGCCGLTEIELNDGLRFMGKSVFVDCINLRSITLPDSITTIEENLFSGCYGLTRVYLPDCVTHIKKAAFSCCRNIETITIPSGVMAIEERAFYNCISLKEVHCLPSIPPIASSHTWDGYIQDYIWGAFDKKGYDQIGCKIIVPFGSAIKYHKAKNWNNYAKYIAEKV